MKNFFTSFLGALAALVIFFVGGSVLMLVVFGAVAAMGNKPATVEKGSYLVLDLGIHVQDTPLQLEELDELMAAFGGGQESRIQLRRLTRETGTVLVIDETHTISSGVGGYTGVHGPEPDMFVLGKAIAGGIPAAVFGLSEAMARRVWNELPPLPPTARRCWSPSRTSRTSSPA